MLIDSAHRSKRDEAHSYRAVFNSRDHRRADTLSDVVSVHVASATLPRVVDNILPDMATFRLDVLGRSQNLSTANKLSEYVTFLNALTDVSSSLQTTSQTLPDGAVVRRASIVISSASCGYLYSRQSIPLFDTKTVPYNDPASSTAPAPWHVLALPATSESIEVDSQGDADVSVNVGDIRCPQTYVIRLDPGFYASEQQFLHETLHGIQGSLQNASSVNALLDTNLVTVDHRDPTETDIRPGWMIHRDLTPGWSLAFVTDLPASDLQYEELFFSRVNPNERDVLDQLGLRSGGHVSYHFEKFSTAVNSSFGSTLTHDNSSDTVPHIVSSQTTATWTHMFQLHFAPVDLIPIRYVDVVISNLPSAALTVSNVLTKHIAVARIDMTSDHGVNYVGNFDTLGNSQGGTSTSGVRHRSYATYTAQFMDGSRSTPADYDHFDIKLVNNFGNPYVSHHDHTIELLVVCLTSPSESIPVPISNTGVLERQPDSARRQLKRLPKSKSSIKQRTKTTVTSPTAQSHLAHFVSTYKYEVTSTSVLFFALWYLATRMRHRNPPSTLPPPR